MLNDGSDLLVVPAGKPGPCHDPFKVVSSVLGGLHHPVLPHRDLVRCETTVVNRSRPGTVVTRTMLSIHLKLI
jgi:hypothetical protein